MKNPCPLLSADLQGVSDLETVILLAFSFDTLDLTPELSYLKHQVQLTNSSHLSISANQIIHGLLMQLWLEQVPLPRKLGYFMDIFTADD